jgi:hypothetical protein
MRIWHVRPWIGRALAAWVFFLAGCEEEIELPPEDTSSQSAAPAVKPLEVDVQRIIYLKADVNFSVPNLIFVVQVIPGQPDQLGITLTASRPAADGARLTFGTFQSGYGMDALAGKILSFASGSLFDPMSNGITTRTAHYQPKFADIKISSVSQTEVRGRLTGDFYRFSLATPSAKPSIVKMEGDFVALLYQK